MKHSKKTPLEIYETRAAQPDFCPLADISAQFLLFVLYLEDSNFYYHKHGYEPVLIREAVLRALRGDLRYGCSTITQQLVKNLYFTFDRRIRRKILELFYASWFEKHLTKNQILELYVNTIYYDNGQYGVRNAARFYFNKEPGDLTANQAFFLAVILPVVGLYNPLYHSQEFSLFLKEKLRRNPFFKRYVSKEVFAEIERHGADCLDEELCRATPETDRYNAPGPMCNERFGPGGRDCLTGEREPK